MIRWKKKNPFKIIFFLLVILMLFFHFEIKNIQLNQSNSSELSIFSLNNSLKPEYIYENIQCRKSELIAVQTTLCVHNLEKDIFVSKSIWYYGVWEGDILQYFLKFISHDHLVFDIGAHIGQYTLFAAKIGNKVIAVEPFYENLIRIHKASKIEKIENRIILVKNALSNKRGQIKKLNHSQFNIGGQNLIEKHENEYNDKLEFEKNRYLVKTICMDDLVKVFPVQDNGEIYTKAVIKLDIEGHESLIFECASLFFNKLNIEIIFMEWMNVMSQNNVKNIGNTIKFLLERDFLPFDKETELKISDWRTWPTDIIWKKIKL